MTRRGKQSKGRLRRWLDKRRDAQRRGAEMADRAEQDGLHALFSLPVFAFEAAFAIYLIVKGFRPSPVLAGVSTT